eukprot:553520-Pyramimonas_sp.AAC.1
MPTRKRPKKTPVCFDVISRRAPAGGSGPFASSYFASGATRSSRVATKVRYIRPELVYKWVASALRAYGGRRSGRSGRSPFSI